MKYKLWNHKYDFAEINKSNFKIIIKDYFYLSISKISFLATYFALNIIFSIISKIFIPSILGFFVIEISVFIGLIILVSFNLFYSILITQIVFIIVKINDPIGMLSLSLIDNSFLIIFGLLMFLTKYFYFKKNRNIEQNRSFIKKSVLIISILSILLISCIAVLYNKLFLINLYSKYFGKEVVSITETKFFFLFLFLLNIIKYSINVFIFIIIYKFIIINISKYKIG